MQEKIEVTWAYNPMEHLDLCPGLLCEYSVILIYLWLFVSEHIYLLKFIFNPNSQLYFFKRKNHFQICAE